MAGFTCWKVILICWIAVIPFVASPSLHKEYLLGKNVAFIPRNEREVMEQTKDLKCEQSEGRKLHLTYLISPYLNETRIGCFYEMHVTVKKCLEYNFMGNSVVIMQPSNYAPCGDFNLTPCNDYSSTQSYELFQCFEKYGGILSPKEKQMRIEHLEREINQTKCIKEIDYLTNKTNEIVSQQENADLHSYNDIVAYIGIVFVRLCILLMLVIFIIPFFIQICRKKVKFRDFWKYCFRILKSLVSSWTADVIQDSLSGQVSNTDEQGTPTDKLRTEDDTCIWEDIALMKVDLNNTTINDKRD